MDVEKAFADLILRSPVTRTAKMESLEAIDVGFETQDPQIFLHLGNQRVEARDVVRPFPLLGLVRTTSFEKAVEFQEASREVTHQFASPIRGDEPDEPLWLIF